MDPPRNRKQRRAAAAAVKPDFDPSSIPLARPPQNDRSKSKTDGKTLVDIISERQNELLGRDNASGSGSKKGLETRYVTVDPKTGNISPLNESSLLGAGAGKDAHNAAEMASSNDNAQGDDQQAESDPIPPLIDTLLLSIPLTVLHLTLAYLAAHQYAQSIEMDVLLRESVFVSFPMLTLLIHLAHGHIISFNRNGRQAESVSLFPWHPDKLSLSFLRRLLFPPSLRTVFFLPGAIALGCKLMAMTNEDTYYAVMKRAPAIGTLWVWCILEIPVGAAALGALGPMAWGVWWKGYGIV